MAAGIGCVLQSVGAVVRAENPTAATTARPQAAQNDTHGELPASARNLAQAVVLLADPKRGFGTGFVISRDQKNTGAQRTMSLA